jgi:hypothetical protein
VSKKNKKRKASDIMFFNYKKQILEGDLSYENNYNRRNEISPEGS